MLQNGFVLDETKLNNLINGVDILEREPFFYLLNKFKYLKNV